MIEERGFVFLFGWLCWAEALVCFFVIRVRLLFGRSEDVEIEIKLLIAFALSDYLVRVLGLFCCKIIGFFFLGSSGFWFR